MWHAEWLSVGRPRRWQPLLGSCPVSSALWGRDIRSRKLLQCVAPALGTMGEPSTMQVQAKCQGVEPPPIQSTQASGSSKPASGVGLTGTQPRNPGGVSRVVRPTVIDPIP